MSFEIRAARAGDAPELATLIRELGLFERLKAEDADVTAVRVAKHLDACLSDDSHSLFVGIDGSGELSAYAAVHWLPYLFLTGPEGYLSELFVAAPARGQGMGTALLHAVVDKARERGCARLMLEAVRTRESYTRGFYTARGWIEREDMANLVFEL